MNKKSIILGLVIIFIVILATGCMFYNVLKPEDFKSEFTNFGYTISDNEEGDYEANTYLVAKKDDIPYEVKYYEFKNEVEAKKVYEKYKKGLSNYITSDSKNKETTSAVKSKTIAVSDNEYIVISRVKNTLIFVAGTNEYSKDIDKILEKVEY